MQKYSWRDIDWVALLQSKVVVSATAAIVTGGAALVGHNLPADMQTEFTKNLTTVLGGVAELATVFALYHRVTAQPDGQTVIVPRKEPTPPTEETKP